MPRGKIKKASTHIDMTPMCDVAFLLLTFFILVGKFKPSEAVSVTPPASVSNKVAPESDFFMVTIDKDNKVYLTMDEAMKGAILDQVAAQKNVSFSDADKDAFKSTDFVGVPLSQLNQYDNLSPDDRAKVVIPGVPYDSTNNELQVWITAAVNAAMGKKMNFLIKADQDAKYPTFKNVIDAFKKNDIYKYNLVTNQRNVPHGSELWKKNMMELQTKGAEAK